MAAQPPDRSHDRRLGADPVAIVGQQGEPVPAFGFRLLGPLDMVLDGAALPMPGGKPKGLLAVLLINRNRVVPASFIADAIWDGDPPAGYLSILQVYMSTLRRSLRAASPDGHAVVITQAPGYRLTVDESRIDLGRFLLWVTTGNELLRAGRFAEASERYRAALAEWSGPALADLRGLRFADDFAAAVEEDRLVALQARIEADLGCGRESALVGELTTLTGQYPLREPFWAQLIIALYRLGRQADALEAGRRIRQRLNTELGIDPGPALRDLEGKILRQESLDAAPPPAARPPIDVPPQAQRPVPPRFQPPEPPGARETSMQTTVSETAVVLSTARLQLPTGQSIPVPSRGLRIGRMSDNDLVVEGSKVSRYHALVVELPNGFAVNDLRSTNGTTVGGQRVVDSHFLRHGDVIRIGGTDLVFELEG